MSLLCWTVAASVPSAVRHCTPWPFRRWAREVLGLIELEPGLPMERIFAYSEIYSGSKIGHFGELRRNSGVAYTDMIFFDDWDKNCNEVGSLGVTCFECRRVSAYTKADNPYPPSARVWKPPKGRALL